MKSSSLSCVARRQGTEDAAISEGFGSRRPGQCCRALHSMAARQRLLFFFVGMVSRCGANRRADFLFFFYFLSLFFSLYFF